MRAWLVLLLAGGLAACGGGDGPIDGPEPGDLVARLTTPNGQDGALLIRVVGPVTEVTAMGGYRVSSASTGNTTMIVVTGNVAGGDLLRLTVPDTRQLQSYSAEIEQAAARDTYALLDPGNYTITLRVQ